jgi:SAM-dependent methyltransferase
LETYSEGFFRLLGSSTVESIDYSDYEKASIVHDMNEPLPNGLKGRFSVVVDAGTLEHVFNFPVAIKNCMELLGEGGHFIGITPANNFMGHGFYQFGPELLFSVFSPQNGFEMVKLIICEDFEDAQWYEVGRPKGGIAGRVTLTNHRPTYLMCIARRLAGLREPFLSTPQQSDYHDAWSHRIEPKPQKVARKNRTAKLFKSARNTLGGISGVRNLVRNLRYLAEPRFPKRDYTPLDPLE